mmetsp:Transcript_23426/g.26683  ORF Transcript_23426/g.26683 Transcript_23426/m.26683 type:complete len:85 (-) Transcript_23426:1-255(-)
MRPTSSPPTAISKKTLGLAIKEIVEPEYALRAILNATLVIGANADVDAMKVVPIMQDSFIISTMAVVPAISFTKIQNLLYYDKK